MNKYTGKAERQKAILEIVSTRGVPTQNELARELKRRGIQATQVSLSRDIAELGLVKAGGVYRAAAAEGGAADPELPLRAWVKGASVAGPHLVVVRCEAGTAQRVGLVIDGLSRPGFVGTIAGDDTVFLAVADAAAGKRALELLSSRMTRP